MDRGGDTFKALLALHEDLPDSLSQLAARRADQNRAALEALALQLGEGAEVQFEQKGILKRLLRIVGR